VELRVGIAGEGDEAELRMVLAQARDRGDAVDDRHVEVDHHRVRLQRVGQFDRVETVACRPDDRQLGLVLDQRLERREETLVVVRQEDANRRIA